MSFKSYRSRKQIDDVLTRLCDLLGTALERSDKDPNRIARQRETARRVILENPDGRLIDWMNAGNLPLDCAIKAHKKLIAEGAIQPREKQE
jgi:hypothetical protein